MVNKDFHNTGKVVVVDANFGGMMDNVSPMFPPCPACDPIYPEMCLSSSASLAWDNAFSKVFLYVVPQIF